MSRRYAKRQAPNSAWTVTVSCISVLFITSKQYKQSSHLWSSFKRPKSSLARPLARNCYYCAQFIAQPKAACALRFSWAATSSNLGLWANMTSSIKPEIHNVSLRRQRRTEPRPQVTCIKSWWRSDVQFRRQDRGQTHTHADRHVHLRLG